MPTFKICGNLYHRIGSLLLCPHESAKRLQIYFVGNEDEEALIRCKYSDTKENISLMKELPAMLHTSNNYM